MKKTIMIVAVLAMVCGAQVGAAKKKSAKLDGTRCTRAQMTFDDGDSFSCRGEAIRVLGIDTPEIAHPRHGIAKNQPYGRKAAAYTRKLLSEARRVVIVKAGRGGYGRRLAHVLVDGELLSVKLIKAGLAYENVSHFGDNGLPEYALAITEAAKAASKPPFQKPWLWRKKYQKRR